MIIYKITNKINGKCYIGQTKRSLQARFNEHEKTGGCLALHRAIKKYGIENFIIEQLDSASSLEELNKKETEYIKQYGSISPNGYNLNTGGGARTWSEESKARMSASHTGKILSQNHKNAIKNTLLKRLQEDPEKFKRGAIAMQKKFKQELANGNHPKRGKKLSDESKKKISQAKIGTKNPMFGKPANEKQKEALLKGQQKRIDNLLPVLCHQNNVIYNSVTQAAKDLGCARSSISNVLIGFRKSCKGYTFEYVKGKSL